MITDKEIMDKLVYYLTHNSYGKQLAKDVGLQLDKKAPFEFDKSIQLMYVKRFAKLLGDEIKKILPYLNAGNFLIVNYNQPVKDTDGTVIGKMATIKIDTSNLHRDSLYYYTKRGRKVYTKDRRGETGIDNILSLFIKGYTFANPHNKYEGYWHAHGSDVRVTTVTHRDPHDVVRDAINRFKASTGYDAFLFDPTYTVRGGKVDTIQDVRDAAKNLYYKRRRKSSNGKYGK